jgi:hypothetical protein
MEPEIKRLLTTRLLSVAEDATDEAAKLATTEPNAGSAWRIEQLAEELHFIAGMLEPVPTAH